MHLTPLDPCSICEQYVFNLQIFVPVFATLKPVMELPDGCSVCYSILNLGLHHYTFNYTQAIDPSETTPVHNDVCTNDVCTRSQGSHVQGQALWQG